MEGRQHLFWKGLGSLRSLRNVVLLVIGSISLYTVAQGTEDFTNLPTASSGSYQSRTWTGTDAVIWTAEGARTDQTLTLKAICFGTSGNRWVTSPVYAGGMGTLSFNYVRGFTSGTARTIQVWVNGVQQGGNISVSTSSNTPVLYSQALNIVGNVQLEIRSISGGQVIIDDINWTTYTAGPTISFGAATASANEAAGSVLINMPISPATVAVATVTVRLTNGAGCSYGPLASNDYQTTPAASGSPLTITFNVPIGSTNESFTIDINDDIATEFNETITCTIIGVTGGLSIGTPVTQVFTIIDNDVTPTVNFSTLSITVMETAGLQNFSLNINPAAPNVAGMTMTVLVTNGPGATYGGGQDYLSNPGIFANVMTIAVPANATSVGFSITVLNDLLVELTETVTFTIQTVPAGMAIGGSTTSLLTIGDDDSPPTVLGPGDLVIVGVNASDGVCSGGPIGGYDLVSFFCFKPIVPGTQIIITDNGYERCNAGQWGNSEGTVRMTRTGIAIPAGQVITFRIENTPGASNVVSFAPDNYWTCASLNAPTGAAFGTAVALNNGGDQLFFMQGGTWNSGTAPANAFAHNATYTGTILYAFSSNPSPNWTATCGGNGSQQSNLPPGVECFSMAPTSASDWGKYDGVVTAATQRDWIIRIDNTAAWTAYASCADYNSMGNSWVSAPILPIIVAPFVPGRWRGSTNTDWFECKNWDDVRVPIATTDVTIEPQYVLQNCVVGLAGGLSPAGTGVCASVSLLGTGVDLGRSLTIANNSTLNVGGPVVTQRSSGSGALNIILQTTATLTATDLSLASIAPGGAYFGSTSATSQTTLSGNVNLGIGGYIDLTNSNMNVGGNWTNLGSEALFVDAGSRVEFNGAGAQSINITTGDEYFSRLVVNKSGGSLTLNSPVQVRTTLDLTSGLVNTSNPAGLLTLRTGGTSINASNTSFVNGPMQKIGDTNYTFPVGKGSVMRPAGITGFGGAVSSFIAEYFPISAYTWGTALEPTIDHISQCEYWTIDRVGGVAIPVVELTWQAPYSCGVSGLPDLIVARWDNAGTIWRDRGNGGAVGTFAAGTIPTATTQTAFNTPGPTPWTLASISALNPLPITLVQFTATPDGKDVRLNWTTASEYDNAFFSIERSRDGVHFEHVLDVPGALNSTSTLNYAEFDREPYPGLSYYRLRQTDIDGSSVLSNVVAVMMGALSERPLVAFYNGSGLTALHGFPAGSRYTLQDMTGRIVAEGSTTQDARTDLYGLDLARGAYLIRLLDGDRMESTRFVY